ncbi:MAG: orotidine-5'-phosphate decarboxylase [Deltaproteobacteria bacterium]|nr:orotidine-5'-phosphate decarboxylase [Deltaproteobacteria bacterium]
MKNAYPNSKLICALDVANLKAAKGMVRRLGSAVQWYKVGLRLFSQEGPVIVHWLKKQKKRVFLDLKLHDIPNTVAEACRVAVGMKVDMLTVHASGGLEMLQVASLAAQEEAQRLKVHAPLIVAVTVLTSLNDLSFLGISDPISEQVLRLAKLAEAAKLSGVVCSPLEIEILRQKFPKTLKLVTPGIRPPGSPHGDQKRVLTAQEAFAAGADYIVVGRPILTADDPKAVVKQLLATN